MKKNYPGTNLSTVSVVMKSKGTKVDPPENRNREQYEREVV